MRTGRFSWRCPAQKVRPREVPKTATWNGPSRTYVLAPAGREAHAHAVFRRSGDRRYGASYVISAGRKLHNVYDHTDRGLTHKNRMIRAKRKISRGSGIYLVIKISIAPVGTIRTKKGLGS
jgi:hypothetical protein